MTRQRIPVTLDPEERHKLLAMPNTRYPTGLRNLLTINLMLDIGLRVSEAVNLKWVHVDMNTGKLHVRNGKGGKDRVLWMRPSTLELLHEWRDRQPVTGDNVLTTLQGKALSVRYIQQMVSRYADKAGIEKRVTPHTLRHTFATDIYRETNNIRMTQVALGHASLTTTMIYTHIVDADLEDAMRNFRGGE